MKPRTSLSVVLASALLLGGGLQAPVASAASPTAVAIAAGGDDACALTTAGGVKCWGLNNRGQLGDGTTTFFRTAPAKVASLRSGVASIWAGGFHNCAMMTSGSARCWGANLYGQLGDGTSTDRHTPVRVSGLGSGVAAVSAGGGDNDFVVEHTCALTTNGGVKCWGYNGTGELGDGTTTDRHTPVRVSGLGSGVAEIAAGWYHTCALTTQGGVKCWGFNRDGQLGDGTTTERLTPVSVSGLGSGVAAVSTGRDYTCALTTRGGVKCWGTNGTGQLGDGTTTERLTPVRVSGLGSGVAAISTGKYHSCALMNSGGVKCWGGNWFGQLGNGTSTGPEKCDPGGHADPCSTTPVWVSGLRSGVASISAGGGDLDDEHTCALTTVGGVKCWGFNGWGQLGDGTTKDRHKPVDVVGFGG